jgi:hypothetical protein
MARSTSTGDLLERVRAEIEERMGQLRPHVEEHRSLLAAAESLGLGGEARSAKPARKRAAGSSKRAAKPVKARRAPAKGKRAAAVKASAGKPRGPRSATQQAIEAALEHGSHTISELVLVTAMEAAPIRTQLGRLQKAGMVSRVRREGKAAYSLLSEAAAAASGPRNGASAK